VVGAINVDVTAHVCGALDGKASTVVGSDTPPTFTQGGRGFNQAVACARLGIATQLVAKIGNDLLARRVIEDGLAEVARRMPLDVSSVLRAEEVPGCDRTS
jgi:sugar/nucleoside kinase (ribokinase family)